MSALDTRGIASVQNFEVLRAVATQPHPDRKAYFALGNVTIADAGLGFFFWNPTSTDADDDDTVIRPNDRSSSAGRWVRVAFSNIIEPDALYGANLFAWYRGDELVVTGAGVSEWTDKTGNLRHLLQGTDGARPPVVDPDSNFGGRPTVNPDGTADFLQAAVAASNFKPLHDGTGGSVLLVVRPTVGAFSTRLLLDTCNASAANVGLAMFSAGTTDSNRTLTVQVAAGGANAVLHTTGAGTFNNGVPHIVCFTYQEGRSPEWELRIDRAATASGASAGAPSAANPSFSLAVARLALSSAFFLNGAVPEIALINRSLTTVEMQAFEDYVLGWYGV